MRLSFLFLALATASACLCQTPCDVSLIITPPNCPGDSDGVITVVPGTPSLYSYVWYYDPGLQGPVAPGLPAGEYTVVVTDTNGCYSVLDTTVQDPVLDPLGTLTISYITCEGLDDGVLTLEVEPGPYTWFWVDDPTITETVRDSLAPGGYLVEIDGGPCPFFLYADMGPPQIYIAGDTTYCLSDPPVLTAYGSYGFQPETYLWTTGDTTAWFTLEPGTTGTIGVTAVNAAGCTVSDQANFTLLPGPTATFAAPDSLCIHSPGTAGVQQTNADSIVWHWGSDGFSNAFFPTVIFDEPGWQPISLQGFDSLGCGNVPVLDSVYVRPRFPAVFTAEQVPCTPTVDLHFESLADSCALFVGDQLVMGSCNGFHNLDLERYGNYDLTFYSTRPDHCDDTSTVHLEVRTVPVAFLPNAFTPNGDDINDTWPGPLDIPDLDYQVHVFDRWGAFIWGTDNTGEKWNGSNLPMGVYVYTMRMRDPCNPREEITKNGAITLFR